jgi:hypothetical protein
MKLLLIGLLALPLAAQTGIPCTLKLGSSTTMKDLYGGNTTVIQGRVSCKNYGLNPIGVSGVDVDLATPTLDTIPASDAQAMLTKTFNNQTGQRATRDLTSGLGVLGIIELAVKTAKPVLNSTWVGVIITSFVSAVQYIIPSFTANEIPTNFNNQCDAISGITLASGQSITCTIYINKPPKGSTQIPSAFGFTLGATTPVNPLPPAPPVQLRRPEPPGGASFSAPAIEGNTAPTTTISLKNDSAPLDLVSAYGTLRDMALGRGDERDAYHWSEKIAQLTTETAPVHPCAFESCGTWEQAELTKR